MSRFGDGEFNFIRQGNEIGKKLLRVLKEPIPEHVVGIPYALIDRRHLRAEVELHWLEYFGRSASVLRDTLAADRVYLDASLTRFYLSHKERKNSTKIALSLQKLWSEKDILIIEGSTARLGVRTDLFQKARSVERILCPPKDAYLVYDKILEAGMQYAGGRTVLLALGQAATGLAYDLAKNGVHALDIGHLDDEYEWLLKGMSDSSTMRAHYRDKRLDNDDSFLEEHPEYAGQIIERVGLEKK